MIFRNSTNIHNPLAAYSHQAEVGSNATWLVLSGQVGMDTQGGIPEDAVEQVDLAMENIRLNLEAAGMEMKDLVKLVFYFVGPHDVAKRREMLAEKLGDHEPCMTVLFVAALANPALKVEIDAWACKEK